MKQSADMTTGHVGSQAGRVRWSHVVIKTCWKAIVTSQSTQAGKCVAEGNEPLTLLAVVEASKTAVEADLPRPGATSTIQKCWSCGAWQELRVLIWNDPRRDPNPAMVNCSFNLQQAIHQNSLGTE